MTPLTADQTPPRVAVDPNALEGLRRFGGDALLNQLVTLFRDQLGVRSAAMHAAVAKGDNTAARQAAHALKSSAGQIGAVGLAELCRLIEQAAFDGDAQAVGAHVAELDEAARSVDAWLVDRGFPRDS